MPDITIPDAAVEAAARALRFNESSGMCELDRVCTLCDCIDPKTGDGYARLHARKALEPATPFIAAQERQRVADEIDLPAVMAHLLRGSRDDLILADRINVAIGASRVRRIEADHG